MIRAKLKLAARRKLKGSWVWGLQIILINILSAFVILSLSTIAFLIFGIFCFAFCTTPLSSNPISPINILNDISIVLYYISISNGRIITAIFAQTFLLTGLVAATYDLINGKKTNNAWGAAFSQFKNNRSGYFITTWFLFTVRCILWSLLLFIPGLIKGLAYSQALYIMQDAVDDKTPMTANEAIALSRKVMDGHKWELLGLMLSFFGWFVLSIITYGIGFFWTLPYMFTTMAEYHKYVMADYNKQHQTGLTNAQVHTTASFSVK